MCVIPKAPKAAAVTAAPVAPTAPLEVTEPVEAANDDQLRGTGRGRASTMFTGPQGLTASSANVATRALTG